MTSTHALAGCAVLLVAAAPEQTRRTAAALHAVGATTRVVSHAQVAGAALDGVDAAVVFPATAGLASPGADESFEAEVAAALFPVVEAARRLSAGLRPGSSLALVTTSAALGSVHGLSLAAHAVAGAVAASGRALAAETGPRGVRVNVVATAAGRGHAPGSPLGRVPDETGAAGVLAWLLSPEAALVTGHLLPVDAGESAVVGAPADGFPPAVLAGGAR